MPFLLKHYIFVKFLIIQELISHVIISLHNRLFTECMYFDDVFLLQQFHAFICFLMSSSQTNCLCFFIARQLSAPCIIKELPIQHCLSVTFITYFSFVPCLCVLSYFYRTTKHFIAYLTYFFLLRAYLHNTFIWLHPCWPYFARPSMVM